MFLMREFLDMPFKQIADVVGVPENTVKSRMLYAREAAARARRVQGSGEGRAVTDRDDGEADDPQLKSLRAVWLAMPDEDPPERGFADLTAAARVKAEQMAAPSLWQRISALLRRPPLSHCATVLVMIGGAVFLEPTDEMQVEQKAPIAHGRASGQTVVAPTGPEAGLERARSRRRAAIAFPGTNSSRPSFEIDDSPRTPSRRASSAGTDREADPAAGFTEEAVEASWTARLAASRCLLQASAEASTGETDGRARWLPRRRPSSLRRQLAGGMLLAWAREAGDRLAEDCATARTLLGIASEDAAAVAMRSAATRLSRAAMPPMW